MQAKDAAVLSIKVLALFVLTRIIDFVTSIVQNWSIYERELLGAERASLPFTIGSWILQIILIVASAGALWYYAEKIARRIFPSGEIAEDGEISRRVTSKELIRIFLGGVGVWLIINSFPQLLAQTISLVIFRGSDLRSNNFDYRSVQFQSILSTLFRFVVGCLLLVS